MKILIVNGLEWGPEYTPFPYSNHVSQWFIDAFGGDPSQFIVWNAQREESPPSCVYHAVVIGGSLSSVYDSEPWIRRLQDQTKRWIDRETPLLGVCFGHQMIAQVMGIRVERNPAGWELGTHRIVRCETDSTDYMLAGLPSSFSAMQVHQDIVTELPPGAECLASSSLCSIQAFRIGDRIRTIQFHPEFTHNHMRYILSPHQKTFEDQGINYRQIVDNLRPTPESQMIFANMKRYWLHLFA